MGFKGPQRYTFAAGMFAEAAAKAAMEHGLREVKVYVKGPGAGREAAIRSLQSAGIDVNVIKDVTRFRIMAVVHRNGEEYNYGQWR